MDFWMRGLVCDEREEWILARFFRNERFSVVRKDICHITRGVTVLAIDIHFWINIDALTHKAHPAIDLLNHKAFVLVRNFSKAEMEADDFSEQIVQTFADIRPFLDYMSNVLTTDSNGVSLI